MTAGIVGLGLIGGSLAKAYRAHGARVLAFDTDGAVLSFAQLDGTVDAVLTKENVSECDIVLIAVRPRRGDIVSARSGAAYRRAPRRHRLLRR